MRHRDTMPTVLRRGPYRFSFYSYDRREPPHVHVTSGGAQAKVWLHDGTLASNAGFTRRQITDILKLVRENRESLLRSWDEFFKT